MISTKQETNAGGRDGLLAFQMDPAPEETPTRLPATPKDHGHARPSLRSRPGPSATSTPMPKEKLANIESQIIQKEAVPSVSSVSTVIYTCMYACTQMHTHTH